MKKECIECGHRFYDLEYCPECGCIDLDLIDDEKELTEELKKKAVITSVVPFVFLMVGYIYVSDGGTTAVAVAPFMLLILLYTIVDSLLESKLLKPIRRRLYENKRA